MLKPFIPYLIALCVMAFPAFAGHSDATVTDISLAKWADTWDGFKGRVQVDGLSDVTKVTVRYTYPAGGEGEVVAKPNASNASHYDFRISPDSAMLMGQLTYVVEVAHGSGDVLSVERKVPIAYVEDLEITANPPEILWFALGDESATVRYKACCNILGASIIAKRIPMNPKETSEGLPDELYSDFIVLEPDPLSASTAGLYFEFGFNPDDFANTETKTPVLYEYHFRKKNWNPVLSFEVVDGKVIDFPATEGGIYVLAKE